jgi:hypothetical protein
VRRSIPFLILIVLAVASGSFAIFSYHQSKMSTVAIFDCSTTSSVAPSTLVLSCADANSMVKNIHWSKWGSSKATGTGVGSWNDCTPDCAGGTWQSANVAITAYRLRDGYYTRVNGSNGALFGGGAFVAGYYPPSN